MRRGRPGCRRGDDPLAPCTPTRTGPVGQLDLADPRTTRLRRPPTQETPPVFVHPLEADLRADFWSAAPGYEKLLPSLLVDPAGARPRPYFQAVPEDKPGRNRWHLDLYVDYLDSLAAEVTRLCALGASEVRHVDEEVHGFTNTFVAMLDPCGNESMRVRSSRPDRRISRLNRDDIDPSVPDSPPGRARGISGPHSTWAAG